MAERQKAWLPGLVLLLRGCGTSAVLLDLSAPASSSSHSLLPSFSAGQLLFLLLNPVQTSPLLRRLLSSLNRLLLLGLFPSPLIRHQIVYTVDCEVLEDRNRVYSLMYLLWYPALRRVSINVCCHPSKNSPR